MRSVISAVFVLVLSVSVAPLESQELKGVWRGTEVEVLNGPDAGVTVLERPRLLIYTDGFFAWEFEGEGEDRPLGNSDAEISQAAQQFNSFAGSYVRDGAEIRYRTWVALPPNAMLPENQDTVREIRTLTATILETQATNADGITTVLRYERLE